MERLENSMKNWKDLLAVPLSPHDFYFPDDPRLEYVRISDEMWKSTGYRLEFVTDLMHMENLIRMACCIPKEMMYSKSTIIESAKS